MNAPNFLDTSSCFDLPESSSAPKTTDKRLTEADLSPDQLEVYRAMVAWSSTGVLRSGGSAVAGSILTVGGFGGTGKSTLLGVFASQFQGRGLAAYVTYTGRAASVLQRKLRASGIATVAEPLRKDRDGTVTAGHPTMPLCSTIHSLLYRPIIDPVTEEIRGWEKRDRLDRAYKLIVVDEASMVSDEILLDIRKHGVPLLAVGDHGQLPPVAAKGDLMQNPALRLEKIHRQAEGSPIIALSKHIREGGRFSNYKGPTGSALRFLFKNSLDAVLRDAYAKSTSPLDVGVLCWTNRTRVTVNRTVREILGRKGLPRKGEAVICLRNRAPVYNGMRGILQDDVETGRKPWLLEGDIAFPDEGLPASVYEMCGAQFNRDKTFGSIEELAERNIHVDKMSEAGSLFDMGYAMTVHKCVDPATLVETPEGLVRAGDLKAEGVVAGPHGRAAYQNRVDYGPGAMLEIVTEDGYGLRVTEDHGVDVWDSSLGYTKMLASKIRPGHVVRLKLGATFRTGGDNKLPDKRPQDVRARDYDLPKSCGTDEAEFFGLMVADGTVYKSGFRLAKRHEDVADRFDSLCRKMFGAAPSRFFTLGAHHVEVSSTLIAGWLRDVGGMAPNAKAIPPVILSTTMEVQAAFLRGLFEDATVNVTEDGRLDHIEFSSVFDDLRRVVRVMLLRFGIVAGSTPSRPESLYIYGGYARLFGDAIGFVSSYKQNKLESGKLGEGTRYTFPLLASEMALSSSGRPEIQRHRARGLQFDERKLFHHSAVASIRHYTGPSVCVEVPAGHRFLQDGFSGWNSQGSSFDHAILFCDRAEKPDEEDSRRFFYTAVTRAASRLTVIR